MPLNQSFALAFGHKNKVSKGEEKQTSNVIQSICATNSPPQIKLKSDKMIAQATSVKQLNTDRTTHSRIFHKSDSRSGK